MKWKFYSGWDLQLEFEKKTTDLPCIEKHLLPENNDKLHSDNSIEHLFHLKFFLRSFGLKGEMNSSPLDFAAAFVQHSQWWWCNVSNDYLL